MIFIEQHTEGKQKDYLAQIIAPQEKPGRNQRFKSLDSLPPIEQKAAKTNTFGARIASMKTINTMQAFGNVKVNKRAARHLSQDLMQQKSDKFFSSQDTQHLNLNYISPKQASLTRLSNKTYPDELTIFSKEPEVPAQPAITTS